jgi:hypothetical protein
MPKKPVTVSAADTDEQDAAPKRRGRPAKVKPAKKSKVAKPTKSAKVKKSAKPAKSGKRASTTPPKGSVNPFAAVCRGLRKKLNKTVREFAEDSGFKHGPAIARLESEDYYGTSVGTMLRIADAVGGELVISIKLGKG